MELTVLGCYGTFPGVDGACSGYLLQEDGFNLLLDCGNGTIGRLQRYVRIEDIDLIVLSHFHLDHIADAFTLKYALETKMARGQRIGPKTLLCPSGPAELAGELLDGSVFNAVNIREREEYIYGNFKLSFVRTRHLIESYAVAVEQKGVKFVYSGDTGLCSGLAKASENADLLLCESTLLESEESGEAGHHLSAGAAGRIAAGANAARLMLTHFWYETDPKRYVDEASRYFANVYAAEELSTYPIGPAPL